MSEIKLGTIGSGPIVYDMMRAVEMVKGVSLYAVYSRSYEKGEALKKQFGAEKIYTDIDAFLSDQSFDFVYIATPNLLHYEQAKKALQTGKNVILEKPFCPQKDQVVALKKLADENGLLLIDATPTAYLPNLKILKEELKKIGKIKLVQGNYSKFSARYTSLVNGEMSNIFNPQFAGGCLMDINYYNVYLTHALFGCPNTQKYYPNLYNGIIDTSGIVILTYNGFTCELTGAKDTWGKCFYMIEGTDGYIYVDEGSNGIGSVTTVTRDSENTYNIQPEPNRYYYEIEGLKQRIVNRDTNTINKELNLIKNVISSIEKMRLDANIIFPCDNK